MKLEIKHHTLLDLLGIGRNVQKAAQAVRYGSYADRNPLAGKMRTCPNCHTRRREGVAQVTPCCNPKVNEFKEAKTPLGRMLQMMGRKVVAGKRKHPHRSAKKLQINEWRLKFEDMTPCEETLLNGEKHSTTRGEVLLKQVQTEMFGVPGRWLPQMRLGKGAAPSLAEQYVAFLRKKQAKALRARRNASLFANRESRSIYAKDLHAATNATVRNDWRKEVGLMLSVGKIDKEVAATILPLYPHLNKQLPAGLQ